MSSSISTSKAAEAKPVTRVRESSSAYYGQLIDLPWGEGDKARAKTFTWALLGMMFAALLFIEAVHQLRPYHNKELSLQMEELAATRNQSFDAVILGDSVVRQPFWGVETSENTLVLPTSAGVTTLGNELIMRRFFDQGNSTKTVVLAFSPTGLLADENNNFRDTLFYPIFRKGSERDLIEARTGVDGAAGLPNGFLKKRKDSFISFLTGRVGVSTRAKTLLPAPLLDRPTHYGDADRTQAMVKKAASVEPDKLFPATDNTLRNLRDLVAYLKDRDVEIVFLLPPVIDGLDDIFFQSEQGKLYLELSTGPGVTRVNANDIRTYPPRAFWDGVHLNRIWEDRFVSDMNTLFPALSIDFPATTKSVELPLERRFDAMAYRGGTVVSKSGESGIDAPKLQFPFYSDGANKICPSARIMADSAFKNSVRVSLNSGKIVDWHFPLDPDDTGWRWVDMDGYLQAEDGWNEITIRRREGAPVAAIRLKVCP